MPNSSQCIKRYLNPEQIFLELFNLNSKAIIDKIEKYLTEEMFHKSFYEKNSFGLDQNVL